MNVSKNELRKETVQTLKRVNDQLSKLELSRGSEAPVEAMATLLLAKAQCLNTITLLNT
jgi:hypothetical protein